MHISLQIAGFAVGLIPLVRKSMIGDAAPLRVIQDSALLLGYEGYFFDVKLQSAI